MRIGFNARTLRDPSRRGFNRYTHGLAAALAGLGGDEIYLLSDSPVHPSFLDNLPARVVTVRSWRHLWWEQVVLPRLIRQLRLDVFHAPASVGLPLAKPCTYVLTVHDVIGRAAPHLVGRASLLARLHHRARERVSLRRADAIIAVSEHARQDIARWLGVAAMRMTVVPEGVEPRFRPMESADGVTALSARYALRPRYVLYVGGFDRRKNVGALIDAYATSRAAAETDLVLAGALTLEWEALRARASALGVEARTRFLGYVPDEHLPALYNGAALFVYPSFYEGFGLQLVEAMACGVPVIAANRTALPEVLAGAGVLVDLDEPAALAKAIDAVLFDPALAARLREQGRRVAAGLTWERAARRTREVYRTAVSGGRRH
jgi:glycosyltransferase involved in cell wall biosynthesis